jgi:small subunit ribosomal protein S4
MEKRAFAPGQHGQARSRKPSEYSIRLREKQKLRRYYGVLEKQFASYFEDAARQRGITGENLLQILESRLDNVVFRMGFANSRAEARQLVKHNHYEVNGKRVNIPSYLTKAGDMVAVRSKSRSSDKFKELSETSSQKGLPAWVESNLETMEGRIVRLPLREEIDVPVDEHLIVELYSR